jgi:hypothetical protein
MPDPQIPRSCQSPMTHNRFCQQQPPGSGFHQCDQTQMRASSDAFKFRCVQAQKGSRLEPKAFQECHRAARQHELLASRSHGFMKSQSSNRFTKTPIQIENRVVGFRKILRSSVHRSSPLGFCCVRNGIDKGRHADVALAKSLK